MIAPQETSSETEQSSIELTTAGQKICVRCRDTVKKEAAFYTLEVVIPSQKDGRIVEVRILSPELEDCFPEYPHVFLFSSCVRVGEPLIASVCSGITEKIKQKDLGTVEVLEDILDDLDALEEAVMDTQVLTREALLEVTGPPHQGDIFHCAVNGEEGFLWITVLHDKTVEARFAPDREHLGAGQACILRLESGRLNESGTPGVRLTANGQAEQREFFVINSFVGQEDVLEQESLSEEGGLRGFLSRILS